VSALEVLVEFEIAGRPGRIVRCERLSPIAEVWDPDCGSWLPMGVGDGDADTGALAVHRTMEHLLAEARAEIERLQRRLEGDDEPTCESGLPDCGEVVTSDVEGIPLCQRCADELIAEAIAARKGEG